MVRLFVAVWPPRAIVDALAAIARPDAPAVRWIPADNWHVTLRFLGDTDADDVAARLGAAELPRASAVVGPAVTRLGRDAVVVPVAGLDALAAAVRSATAGVGRDDDARREQRRAFHGHITIARLRTGGSSPVSGAPVTGRFEVGEVSLVSSTTLATGARYTRLGTWATAGG